MTVAGVPLGHFISAHLLLGFCGVCQGRDELEEVIAWRIWAVSHVPEVHEALSGQDPKPRR